MAKFLLMSQEGDALALARRLVENGHQVHVWIRNNRSKQNFDGLVPKVSRYENQLEKDTIVFFDSTGGGKAADQLRARGHKVIIGSVFADQLEHDRDLAFGLMEEVGIKVPQTEKFTSWDDARAFVKKNGGRWAFKPSGTFGKKGDALGVSSYMPHDEEDLIGMMYHFEDCSKGMTPEFVLQKFIADGVAISTEGWFNGKEFMYPFNHTVERKQLMDHNLGPSGGCAGNCVWAITRHNHIVEEGVKKMTPILRQFDYRGPLDLNTIVNNDGVWALEFTPRFGYDALPSFLELYEGDIGELFIHLAEGSYPKEMVLKGGFASGLRITVPPYPSEEFTPNPGVPVNGFTREDRPHLFFHEVMLNKRDQLVTSGSGGAVVTITGLGESIPGSLWPVEEMAQRAIIPDKQYRSDLIHELDMDYSKWKNFVQER